MHHFNRIFKKAFIILLICSTSVFPQNSEPESNTAAHPTLEKAISIASGFALGIIVGGLVGSKVLSEENGLGSNILRGAILGATILPVAQYELTLRRPDIPSQRNRFGLYLGGQLPYTNHSNSSPELSYTIGINRVYNVSEKSDMLYTINYGRKKIVMPDTKVLYNNYWADDVPSEIRHYDVNYSVAYIDVGLIHQYHLIYSKCRLSLGVGLMASVQISNKTEFLLKETETPAVISDNDYDFRYENRRIQRVLIPIPAIAHSSNLSTKNSTSLLTIKRSFWKAPQIYPLDDQSQIYNCRIRIRDIILISSNDRSS